MHEVRKLPDVEPHAIAEDSDVATFAEPRLPVDAHWLVAGLTIVAVLLAANGEIGANAAEASAVHPSPNTPAHKHAKAPQHCLPREQIKLSLVEPKTTKPGHPMFTLVAKSCVKTTPSHLENVTLEEFGPHTKRQAWPVKKFPAGSTRKRNFAAPQPGAKQSKTGVSLAAGHDQSLTLKAVSKKGVQLGIDHWKLRYVPGKTPGAPASFVPEEVQPEPPATCTPNPNLQIGAQDDNQFVFQKDISRDDAFNTASSMFGATLLRINMIYGVVQRVGLQPYVDTVNAAKARGWDVDVTIMPDPTYDTTDAQDLNSDNLSPEVMNSFADTIASTLAGKVQYYSIGNEPNISLFNTSLSMAKFNAMYTAGFSGVHTGDPNAKVIAGELAPSDLADLDDWVADINTLPNDGVAMHPYGDVINHLGRYVALAKTSLELTEYGNPINDPNQMADDLSAISKARCAGPAVGQLVLYQLIRNYANPWDTGVLEPPNSTSTAPLSAR